MPTPGERAFATVALRDDELVLLELCEGDGGRVVYPSDSRSGQ